MCSTLAGLNQSRVLIFQNFLVRSCKFVFYLFSVRNCQRRSETALLPGVGHPAGIAQVCKNKVFRISDSKQKATKGKQHTISGYVGLLDEVWQHLLSFLAHGREGFGLGAWDPMPYRIVIYCSHIIFFHFLMSLLLCSRFGARLCQLVFVAQDIVLLCASVKQIGTILRSFAIKTFQKTFVPS